MEMAHIIIALNKFLQTSKSTSKAIFESTQSLEKLKNIDESFWQN